MTTAPWQGSLLALGEVALDATFAGLEHHELADGAWLDHRPGWLAGADGLLTALLDGLPWTQRTERIQGRDVPQPRLTAHLRVADLPAPLQVFRDAGAALSARYGVALERLGVNHYRDGRDSVAWHGDRVARDLPTATVAIVSVGEARSFRCRPATGGRSRSFRLGHGDLLVMGGSFQRTWRHAVPKQTSAGPRISVTYRHAYPPVPFVPAPTAPTAADDGSVGRGR